MGSHTGCDGLVLALVVLAGVLLVVGPQAARAQSQSGILIAQGRSFNDPPGIVPPRGDDAIDRLLDAVQVDRPVSYRGLTLFPISLRRDYADFLPKTFDKAVRDRDLIVEEVGGGEVNSVRVRNDGSRAVFIMAGEIMIGSKQDRTLQRDVLIGPRSGWVTVPVYCVEAGRWTVVSPTFGTKDMLAAPSLRAQAYAGAEQSSIWSEVDRVAGEQGVRQSSGRAFQEIYEDREVKGRVDDYLSHLRPSGERVVGLVAFSGREPLAADLFAHEDVFGALRDKLIKSYVLQIRPELGAPREDTPQMREAARFLARAWSEQCSRISVSTPGIGESLRLRNQRTDTGGGALIYHGGAVHVSLFPTMSVEPIPLPGPGPMPIPRSE